MHRARLLSADKAPTMLIGVLLLGRILASSRGGKGL